VPRPAGLALRDRYALPGPRLFPESVAFDARRQAFFVSSMSGGSVTRVASDGTTTTFYAGTGEPRRLTLGVKVDAPRDRLVVCTLLNQKPREQPHVYRIRHLRPDGTYELSLFARHPLLAKPAIGVGQNGAAITPDGKTLLTTQYLPPRLWRIPLDRPDAVSRVSVSFPSFSPLSGADGMAFWGDDLYLTFGSSLLLLRSPDARWESATWRQLVVGTRIASVTVAGRQLYVLKSDVARFILGGTPPLPFELLRIDPAELDPR
jgi:sugar lactone lactonase YvrE